MKVGFVGWRGMVGSVLMQRMVEEGDLAGLDAYFFSTSQIGAAAPFDGYGPVMDAMDLDVLEAMDVIVTCQGGSYTEGVHGPLRARGWRGYWIDAASTLRMAESAIIVLDPVNGPAIERAIDAGVRDYIGGNCTVTCMLMGLVGLFRRGWVEWMSTMTYQAASGAGAEALRELLRQMAAIGEVVDPALRVDGASILDLDRAVSELLRSPAMPTERFGAPLAASLIPWIDRAVEHGQTREEWKGIAETNKILEQDPPIPVDGLCVRVGAIRCHSQAITIKLKHDVPLAEIEAAISEAHPWVELVPNTREATLERLSPAAVSGTLTVPVGRLRKLRMGPEYLGLMTVGDQLLWGAAEPLRRMLAILRGR
jgi:aspartate-semialdehyde dehydrogenase